MAKKTHFLDLDAVFEEQPDVVINVDGASHRMVHTTVESFIANTKLIESLRAGEAAPSFEAEFSATVEIVARAFPTIGVDRLMKMTFHQLNRLMETAKQYSGQNQVEAETAAETAAEAKLKGGAENPQVAAA